MKISYRILTFSLFSFLFLSVSLFIGCKKENPSSPVNTATLAEYHISGLLGNEVITVQTSPSYFTDVSGQNTDTTGDHNNDGHHDNGHHGTGNPDEDDNSAAITGCEWSLNNTATGSVELRKEVFRIYVTPFLANQYYGMLEPGAYSFVNADNRSGAYITLLDKSGVVWTSRGEQNGSSFQIITRGANEQTFTKITGAVNCKMYDADSNMKIFAGTFTAKSGL